MFQRFCSDIVIEKSNTLTKLVIESDVKINWMQFEFSNGTTQSAGIQSGSKQTEFSFEGKYLIGIDAEEKTNP